LGKKKWLRENDSVRTEAAMKSAIVLALCATGALHAQDVSGDWMGTLKAGPAELRLALHITKATDGTLKATLDSLDQGANGIPTQSVKLADSKLTFDVGAVNGNYEGKVNPEGSVITGTWSQGQSMPLEFHRGAFKEVEHKPGKPSDIDGDWKGSIDTPQGSLGVVIHIVNAEDGLTAKMDVPLQGAKGIPASSVTRSGASLRIEIKAVGGGFEGKISSDLSTIDGTWSQLGNSLPLVLKR
jgi:hypothetical protein